MNNNRTEVAEDSLSMKSDFDNHHLFLQILKCNPQNFVEWLSSQDVKFCETLEKTLNLVVCNTSDFLFLFSSKEAFITGFSRISRCEIRLEVITPKITLWSLSSKLLHRFTEVLHALKLFGLFANCTSFLVPVPGQWYRCGWDGGYSQQGCMVERNCGNSSKKRKN